LAFIETASADGREGALILIKPVDGLPRAFGFPDSPARLGRRVCLIVDLAQCTLPDGGE
jgi:hypothetical protein